MASLSFSLCARRSRLGGVVAAAGTVEADIQAEATP
jgi:hypothetical protein